MNFKINEEHVITRRKESDFLFVPSVRLNTAIVLNPMLAVSFSVVRYDPNNKGCWTHGLKAEGYLLNLDVDNQHYQFAYEDNQKDILESDIDKLESKLETLTKMAFIQ